MELESDATRGAPATSGRDSGTHRIVAAIVTPARVYVRGDEKTETCSEEKSQQPRGVEAVCRTVWGGSKRQSEVDQHRTAGRQQGCAGWGGEGGFVSEKSTEWVAFDQA